jgi:hypothetical protein
MARKQNPVFVLVLAAALLAMLCQAQYPVAWDQPGKVGPEKTNPNGLFQFDADRPAVALKDRPFFTAMAKQVFQVLLAMPTLAQPRGFDVLTFGSASSADIDGKTDSARPHRVSGYMRVRMPVYLNFGNRIGSSGEAFAAEITVVSNTLERLATTDKSIGMVEDDQGKMYFPSPLGAGVSPRGYAKWGSWVVMTHRTAPIFRPVGQERVLNWIAAEAQQKAAGIEKGLKENQTTLEQLRKSSPEMFNKMSAELEKMQKGFADQAAAFRKFIAETRAQIAGMTPAQRQAPAHFKPNYQPCCSPFLLVAANEPGAQEVVALNPDFFDAALPPTAPQIFAVMISQQVAWPRGQLDQKLAEELDWHALEGLLK